MKKKPRQNPDYQIRRLQGKFHLRLMIFLIILSVLIVVYWISSLIGMLLESFFGMSAVMSPILSGFLLSLILGVVISVFVSKIILSPVVKLGRQMRRVAEGDMTISPETGSKLSEIQDLYDDFNRMVRELSAAETQQKDFISGVSHEFKTPITAIEGYAALLQSDEMSSDEQRECIEKILLHTQRLSDLVGKILLLSRLENQAIPSQKTFFQLDEQIRYAILALEAKWTVKNIDFDIDMADIRFYGCESLLLHVWLNLLDNAIKFSPQGGKITIRLAMEDSHPVFRIRDRGPGVNEAMKERIFEKFYQEDTSRKQEGSGLGLTLVRFILNMENATIDVENMADGGCCFTVIFP